MPELVHQSVETIPQVLADGICDCIDRDLLRILARTPCVRGSIVLGKVCQVNNTENSTEG